MVNIGAVLPVLGGWFYLVGACIVLCLCGPAAHLDQLVDAFQFGKSNRAGDLGQSLIPAQGRVPFVVGLAAQFLSDHGVSRFDGKVPESADGGPACLDRQVLL